MMIRTVQAVGARFVTCGAMPARPIANGDAPRVSCTRSMQLRGLQEQWTALGEQDPLWAILSAPGKRGGAWDLDEFFATGRQEVDHVLRLLADGGIPIELNRALDFGCGVGRLTQALAGHFESCDGVDVAASMIEQARELNQNPQQVRFHHNDAVDLRLFGDASFDFILALIVLQHMQPQLMRGYIREFVRVLRPGGVAFFSVPECYLTGDELPSEGWRASVALLESISTLAPGEVAPLKVRVRNESPVPWETAAQLRVGDRWLASDGSAVMFEDARAFIETRVEPGGECEIQLDVVAPRRPGRYQLEVDLIQESIGWFADRGSSALRLPVLVFADGPRLEAEGRPAQPDAIAGGRTDQPPAMEMHAMARDDVLSTVEEAGGVALDLIARNRCGPAFPSVDYVVARAITPVRSAPTAAGEGPDSSESRVRPAVEQRSAARAVMPSGAGDPGVSERRRRAQRMMDDRLDIVDFTLTSRRRRLGRASVLARTGVRRLMFQVLHRQTEFNQATSELIRSHGAELEALDATVKPEADERLQALESALREAVERNAELERRVARMEFRDAALTRRKAAEDAAEPEASG
jgi:SAM-dependent methyltransferase